MPQELLQQFRGVDKIAQAYSDNWGAIRTHHSRNNRVQDVYNFRIDSLDVQYLGGLVSSVYSEQGNYFKLNLSFGFILRSRLTGELRYFHSSFNNHRLLEHPVIMGDRRDIDTFIQQLEDIDIEQKQYSKSFSCSRCRRLFKAHKSLQKHVPRCKQHVTYRYPGGVYELPPTIFDRLQEIGICISKQDQFYPYRITYDIETYLDKDDVLQSNGTKLKFLGQHKLLSISVCSNVPGFTEPKCFISQGDPGKLVDEFVNYCHTISQTAFEIVTRGLSIRSALEVLESMTGDEAREFSFDEDSQGCRPPKQLVKSLLASLINYCRQIPVVGFNSGKYDVNLLRGFLYKSLENLNDDENRPSIDQIIKRNCDYMAISCKWFKFLDIKNYLAPGCSYKQFLKAYKCEEEKGFFPYDWMDKLEKLSEPALPPHEAFYNKLKGENISEEDYQHCVNVWETNQMEKFSDFLIWYNNKDVVPFLEAIEKMFSFYREKNIDMFKHGISVPGLTLRYLFNNLEDTHFCIFPHNHSDLYHVFRENVVGGPSIVFNRYHEKGKTYLRGGDKVCEKILGFDANALYLWAIMQDMPTGIVLRRRAETGFKPEFTHAFQKAAVGWMEWEGKRRGVHIKHGLNGKEVRLGERQLPVDGFGTDDSGNSTILQFHGCYWHGHPCKLNEGRTQNSHRNKPLAELYEETKANSNYLQSLGFEYIEKWECEWKEEINSNPNIKSFLKDLFPYALQNRWRMSAREIIHHVKKGTLFGAVECDIIVPDDLKHNFSEMPPIFKNCEVSVNDIGEHMAKYAEDHNLMKHPRRTLIGSMCGEKILIATPLLRWYLDHGLKVTKVYQLAQFIPKPVFKDFGEEVSNARRDGDKDPAKSIIADTMKLIGNSADGKPSP
ncbi:hypothetical protein HOLleu_40418 [Holothuria leucospilota]|uniref:DNA-directed DNA polymerase n=1 Tax=Holothuria leucospilota TaxID=206669 RepID=A0A9Q0YHP8_HOLLE|nr:hypothetical protein HOLleu_40418 [Holothuria leucospilota]